MLWSSPAARQAVLYHGDVCAVLGEDAALELCDWACRQLAHLNEASSRHAGAPGACFEAPSVTAGPGSQACWQQDRLWDRCMQNTSEGVIPCHI